MKERKYLTKTVFKIGLECPRKLQYLHKDDHLNKKVDDTFLESLARGGFQVGALAQLQYPQGVEVTSKIHQEALDQTAELLKKDSVVIFEAAFASGPFFVRADIVVKFGSKLRLIEVKSKSFDPSDPDSEFLNKRDSKPEAPKISSDWAAYLYDLAYQVFVARKAFPQFEVSASFMGLDKTASCPEDRLHQLFLVQREGRSKKVLLTRRVPPEFQGFKILKDVDLTELVGQIIEGKETSEFAIRGPLAERAERIAAIYLKNEIFPASEASGPHCRACEFRGSDSKLKSGFDECWDEIAGITSASAKKMSFDLWNFRGARKALENGKYLLEDLEKDDLGSGSAADRQITQIDLYRTKSENPWIDRESLRSALAGWSYPLHFIDFETCMPALPFKKGFSPYSEVAFQFSHHVMHSDGHVEHAGQFIDLTPGRFPTFDFLREMKRQLEKDDGTIFRYSNHENSVINRAIFLLEQTEEPDKNELISFFKTITNKKDAKKKNSYLWKGSRDMVDLLEVVKSCYLSPRMGSSNSLKYVLPAILNESAWLQHKYSRPVYGTPDFPSLNFKNHTWIQKTETTFRADPYQQLDPLFSAEDLQKIEGLFSDEEEIKNGGAAMMAYCKSQFTEMSQHERDLIQKALLKYCELDTLAMVMLVEYWREVCDLQTAA